MSSHDLKSLARNSESDSLIDAQTKTLSYTWLLPVGLFIGFAVILTTLFADRFLPASEVITAQVFTLRSNIESDSIPTSTSSTTEVSTKGSMLFQASGWIEPDPYTIFVPALTDGIVKRVYVLEGQEVKKDQLLAELIDDDAKLILISATQKYNEMQKRIIAHCLGIDILDTEIKGIKSQIQTTEIKIQQVQDELNRFSKLSKGTVSDQQKVQAQFKLKELKSESQELQAKISGLEARKLQINAERESMNSALNELKTQVDTAKLALDRTKIYAPIDGTVLHLHAAPGKKRILRMDDPKSTIIVELYNPKKLQARIDVPLNEAASMRLGQNVELKSDLLPNKVFNGHVTRIAGQADIQRNTLQAKVGIKSPDPRLRPDMLIRAKFFSVSNNKISLSNDQTTSSRLKNRLSIFVPKKAIFDQNYVWVISTKNKAELRKVTLGSQIKSKHQHVTDGVKSGEQVILPPFDGFKEGTRVRVTNKL